MIQDDLVFKHVLSPLSSVDSHNDISCIKRYFNEDCPYYIAIHKIENASFPQQYTFTHTHKEAEINILISDDPNFKYEISIDGETNIYGGNYTICIPPGVPHSANVISGSGIYIAIRLNDKPISNSKKGDFIMNIREEIIGIISVVGKPNDSDENFTIEDFLIEMDSLKFIELVTAIENKFDITLTSDDMMQFKGGNLDTVEKIVENRISESEEDV